MRIEIKNIVCATDMSPFSNHTITYGIALARAFEAKVSPCHIIGLPSVATHYGMLYLDPLQEQERLVAYVHEHFDQMFAGSDVPWEPIITLGHAADEIARISGDPNVDLIITATHGRSGFKRLLLGSVTEQIMRSVSCPLLIVGQPEPDRKKLLSQPFKFEHILVGCDFSPDASLALEYAISLAQEFQAAIHLVHVVEPPVYVDMVSAAMGAGHAGIADFKNRLQERLEALMPKDACNWCDPRFRILDGQAYDEIPAYAQANDIDLIVMGARGYGMVEKLFVGSTTDRVVRRAPCPVLSVSPKAKVTGAAPDGSK